MTKTRRALAGAMTGAVLSTGLLLGGAGAAEAKPISYNFSMNACGMHFTLHSTAKSQSVRERQVDTTERNAKLQCKKYGKKGVLRYDARSSVLKFHSYGVKTVAGVRIHS